jgi:uncharacterized protein with HEPN domain
MTPKLGDEDYLRHIEEAAAKIDRFMAGKSDADFLADEFTQDAVIRNLEVVGEAVAKLSDTLRKTNADIPWQDISACEIASFTGISA